MHVDQALGDRQAEPCALFGRLDRIGALAERSQHDRDFILGDAGAGVLDAEILPARGGPADLEPDLAALRGELDRVGQQVEHDLARGALVAPDPRHALFEHLVDGDAAAGRAQFQQMMAVGHDMHQRDRFLVEFVAAGLDPRQIENLVDQVEQVDAGIMDVGGVFLVDRHRMRRRRFRSSSPRRIRGSHSAACAVRGSSAPGSATWRRWRIRRDAALRPRSPWPVRVRRSARPFRRALPASPASSNAGDGRAARNSLRRRSRAAPSA